MNNHSTFNRWLISCLIAVAIVAILFITERYAFEAGTMTDEERIELVAEELNLPEKHIRLDSPTQFSTINGTYIVDFGETENETYFIRTIVKNDPN